MGGQAFDLLHIEHGVALHEGDGFLLVLAGLRVGLGLGHRVGIDDQAAMLALSDVSAQFVRLFERHPDRGDVTLGGRFHPQHQDIHPGIGLAVMTQGAADPPGGVFGVPRPQPRPHALLKVGNNFLGDSGVNVRVHGENSLSLFLVFQGCECNPV